MLPWQWRESGKEGEANRERTLEDAERAPAWHPAHPEFNSLAKVTTVDRINISLPGTSLPKYPYHLHLKAESKRSVREG